MGETKFANAPIIEAVIDLDCDMPPATDLDFLEGAMRDKFRDTYPKFRRRSLHEHTVEMKQGESAPNFTSRQELQALQVLHDDGKQLVQFRRHGYSFNRLEPYSSLDDYLCEVERTWRGFVEIVSPVRIRRVRLRYINRLKLPAVDGHVQLDDYLRVAPHLPDEEDLTFVGFLNQHSAIERKTGNEANIVLASRAYEGNTLPIIFDITASRSEPLPPDDWKSVRTIIDSLRNLKNAVFRGTLTESCLELFR